MYSARVRCFDVKTAVPHEEVYGLFPDPIIGFVRKLELDNGRTLGSGILSKQMYKEILFPANVFFGPLYRLPVKNTWWDAVLRDEITCGYG